jgi:hypothetical protein
MIFHGVYTTPQIIDSTLSTTSNNAVNGKAVADYVEAQLENVGGGCSICREDVFLPYTGWEFRFEITKSQAIILGKHVKLYLEFVVRYDSNRNTAIESVIGTLKDDIPPPDSDADVIFPWISQDREIPATLSGSELRFVQGEGLSTIMQNDTFTGTIEWGGPSVAGSETEIKIDDNWFNYTDYNKINKTSAIAYKNGNYAFIYLNFTMKENTLLTDSVQIADINSTYLNYPLTATTVPFIFAPNPESIPSWLTTGFLYGNMDCSGRIYIGHMPNFTIPAGGGQTLTASFTYLTG